MGYMGNDLDFSMLSGIVTAVAAVLGAGLYIYTSFKTKGDQIDDDTISRLNNAIDALKLENESLRRENDLLKANLVTMQSQIDQSKADIVRLTDLATNQTAIGEVKSLLEQFKFIIPTIQQFQQSDHEVLTGLKEIRDLIRKLPQKKAND